MFSLVSKVINGVFRSPVHSSSQCTSIAVDKYKGFGLLQNLDRLQIPSRNLTKFSLQKGKRKSVKAVIKRFYRLDWGIWIRGMCGRQKKLYKKSLNRKHRLRRHVFTNASQSWLLDSLVGRYWRKPRFYVDDPYQPYHLREEFPFTRQSPWKPL